MSNKWLFLIGLLTLFACNPEDKDTDTPVVPSSDKILLKTAIMNSMCEIYDFKSEGSITDYDLYMAVGETEHVQVSIYARDYNVFEMKWANLHPEIELSCRTFADYGEYHNEVLIPCNYPVADSNMVVNLWLSFKANSKAKTYSKYTENISFTSSTSRANLKITIHTGNIVLPETPVFPTIFGIYTKNAENLKAYSDFLLDYRISPYFFDGWGQDGHSINCFSSPYSYGSSDYWNYLKENSFSAIALPFYNLSGEELRKSIAKAKQEGIWKKVYYYIYDEPSEVAQFEKLKIYADSLHAIDPDAKVLTSFYREPQDGPRKGEGIMATFDYCDLGRSDIYCVEEDENGTAGVSYKSRLRDYQQWWSYVAGWEHPGISHHSTKWEHRAVMWRQYLDGPSGFLYWAANWKDSKNLDGQLIFPDSEGLSASVRLERFRDGLEECEMLKLYEQEHSRSEAVAVVNRVFSSPCCISQSEAAINSFHKSLVGL